MDRFGIQCITDEKIGLARMSGQSTGFLGIPGDHHLFPLVFKAIAHSRFGREMIHDKGPGLEPVAVVKKRGLIGILNVDGSGDGGDASGGRRGSGETFNRRS